MPLSITVLPTKWNGADTHDIRSAAPTEQRNPDAERIMRELDPVARKKPRSSPG